jgi:UMF1 family MFS transporter
MKSNPRLARFSWCLYDLANTIFSMNIVSLYFVLWLTVERDCPELYYSLALGISIFLAALIMPIIGDITDKLRRRVPFLAGFTLACVFCTALLGLVKTTFFALFFFALANFFYQLSGVVYNSILPQVSTPQTLGRTSGLGVSLGYLGAILGLLLVKPFLELGGKQATFIPTAFLFLFFAVPAFIFIKDVPHPRIPKIELKMKHTLERIGKNLSQIRQDPAMLRFLISAFLCLNAVNTIIVFMGVYAKRVINFSDAKIIYFMSISTVFAIVGSYLIGLLTDRWGSRNSLNLIIKAWCLTIFFAGIAVSPRMFWIIGPLSGICLGGTWVAARTMLVELVPEEKIGQMFGLFGLAGRFSSILGPIIWGIIVWALSGIGAFRYRIAIASVFLFMFAGYLTFQKVPDPRKAKLEK